MLRMAVCWIVWVRDEARGACKGGKSKTHAEADAVGHNISVALDKRAVQKRPYGRHVSPPRIIEAVVNRLAVSLLWEERERKPRKDVKPKAENRRCCFIVFSESMLLYKYVSVRCARTTEETKPKQDRNLLTAVDTWLGGCC